MGFLPETNLYLNFAVLAVCFFILTKSADALVDGAVGIAIKLNVPKIIIGIILVGFATTAPEFTVSMISALSGLPEIALGNAVGSVIADTGLALALGILVAPAAIPVNIRTANVYNFFLLGVSILAFVFVFNGTISRPEGVILISLLGFYIAYLVIDERRRRNSDQTTEINGEITEHIRTGTLAAQGLRFLAGVAGVVVASWFLVDSAENIALFFGAPNAVVGLTIVAIGTSLPEIATAITASKKGHGDLALGDILGANLLNILWIIGTAATARPIHVSRTVILFSFPTLLFFVIILLVFTWIGQKLETWKGVVLLILYVIYLSLTIVLFYVYGIEVPVAG
jgi:cation:H+ antiporter